MFKTFNLNTTFKEKFPLILPFFLIDSDSEWGTTYFINKSIFTIFLLATST